MSILTNIHHLRPEEVYISLRSSPEGLSADLVRERLAVRGRDPYIQSHFAFWAKKVVKQFSHFLAIVLWGAAVLCFGLERFQPGEGMLNLGWAIVLIVSVNGAFSFVQEFRAEKAARALKKILPLKARVVRSGTVAEVPVDDLVEGDVVLLREGDRVPADIRLVETDDLKVNNAVLTGESDVLLRTADASPAESIFDADNIVFSGTLILSGRGTGVVFAAGSRSRFGRVARLTTEITKGSTPLEKEIARASRTTTLIAACLAAVFFALGVAVKRPFLDNVLFAIGILVALIPEGLLPTVTLTLAAGSQRMARRHALVKELSSIETLGCTTVICVDKTGTITQNEMTVKEVWVPDNSEDARQRAYLVMGLANTVSPLWSEGGEMPGDPMEVALLRASSDYLKGSGDSPKTHLVDMLGFTPERKRLSVLYSPEGREGLFLATKGAPETVLPLGRLTAEEVRRVEKAVLEMSGRAMRVLALARRAVPPGEGREAALLEREMEFVGLVGLIDPIRPEVPEAVARCHTAGIRVMMITGDGAATARAIAAEAGLVPADGEPVTVLTGDIVDGMGSEELKNALRAKHVVFARMQPEHKLRVVTALQEKGEIVAMTGDGVNDAPALRKADIGIAMGLRGTDVARESANLVLLDDHFATIVNVIEEGRAVFANIRKFVTYILSSNIPELVPFLAHVLLRIPLPLSIIQIMAIDLGTDMLPALALGLEKPRPEMMNRPPRSRHEPLLTRGLLLRAYGFLGVIEAAAGMAGYFYVLHRGGWHWGQHLAQANVLYLQATTACLSAIVFAQVGNLFACRSAADSTFRIPLNNPAILWGLVWELGILALVACTGPGRALL
ncbi:MAG: cation-transporting P-type ATPase, partial [Thermoanaerobacterales bacterium]|nr:cation-transporting P-type ATPase [Thermoanaerobacterales bacterium]